MLFVAGDLILLALCLVYYAQALAISGETLQIPLVRLPHHGHTHLAVSGHSGHAHKHNHHSHHQELGKSLPMKNTTTATVLLQFECANSRGLQHVELPLGQIIDTQAVSGRPLHPLSAKILGLRRTEDDLSPHPNTKEPASITCVAHPHPDMTRQPHEPLRRRWHLGRAGLLATPSSADSPRGNAVWWTELDGRVNFEDASQRFWLRGLAVSAYECF